VSPAFIATVVVGLAIAYVVWQRVNEIFAVSVRDGRVLVVRGRIPSAVLHSITDVVRRANVRRGTVRAVAGQHHARLVTSGIDEGTTQRLRNVFGVHPVQKLRGAKLPDTRNLGQLLGIAWLAWLFVPRGD
jgi:hypothetical protein